MHARMTAIIHQRTCLVLGLVCLATILARTLWAAEPVRVVVAGPMVGTSYAVGVQYQVGVNAALKTLPDGILLDRPVEVSLYDDNCKDTIAESVAREIVENPPAVVIGHSCSGATIAAAPIYAEHGVLEITPASTNPKVTEMGISTIFRMIGRDDLQGKLAAERIATRYNGRRIGVISFHGAYSRGLAAAAVEALKGYGISPVIHVQDVKGTQPSYIDKIEIIMAAELDVLYLVGGGTDCAVFLRQARQLGADFDVVGSDTLVSEVFLQAAGPAAEGVPFTFPPDAATLSTAAPAVEAIEALGHEPVGYTLLAYAALQVWIEGVRRSQSFDAGRVAASIRQGPITTILGDVAFDAKGDITTQSPPFAWYMWKDGQRVAAD
ncbi:MAG: hypothetical protein EOM25_09245 [Deltaproteobacteria bacterium]|nr:hypothetical protein [Deltaproteobacteria bacterium]